MSLVTSFLQNYLKPELKSFIYFFDPWFSLLKFKKGDTEYGVGWLPLGGYVKISGMIDESMDKEALKEEPKPYEFRAKPAYQRILIMIGGVLVNFILAFFIFWMILFKWGEGYIDVKDATYGLAYHPIAHEIGLQDGDIVTAVDSFKVQTSSDIQSFILLEGAKELTVQRKDSTFKLTIPADFSEKFLENEVKALAVERIFSVVDSVFEDTEAAKAGIKKGDVILKINGKEADYARTATSLFQENAGKRVVIELVRDEQKLSLSCNVSDKGKVGLQWLIDFDITHIKYGFWGSTSCWG